MRCENGEVETVAFLELGGHSPDRARLAAICQRFGISELAVFGSVARGNNRPESDIDLLFELAPDARLGFAISSLQSELEQLFCRPVDLLSKDSIHRLIRDEVLAEAKVLYAA